MVTADVEILIVVIVVAVVVNGVIVTVEAKRSFSVLVLETVDVTETVGVGMLRHSQALEISLVAKTLRNTGMGISRCLSSLLGALVAKISRLY
jgi:hypothetical protein